MQARLGDNGWGLERKRKGKALNDLWIVHYLHYVYYFGTHPCWIENDGTFMYFIYETYSGAF